MPIKVERKGDKVVIETDRPDGDASQWAVHQDRSLVAAMKVFGINKVEGNDTYDLKKDFDNKFKERSGRESGYFYPT